MVLPEFVPSHWWEHLRHNQTALRLKAALLFHPGVVMSNVFHPGVVMSNVPYRMASKPAT